MANFLQAVGQAGYRPDQAIRDYQTHKQNMAIRQGQLETMRLEQNKLRQEAEAQKVYDRPMDVGIMMDNLNGRGAMGKSTANIGMRYAKSWGLVNSDGTIKQGDARKLGQFLTTNPMAVREVVGGALEDLRSQYKQINDALNMPTNGGGAEGKKLSDKDRTDLAAQRTALGKQINQLLYSYKDVDKTAESFKDFMDPKSLEEYAMTGDRSVLKRREEVQKTDKKPTSQLEFEEMQRNPGYRKWMEKKAEKSPLVSLDIGEKSFTALGKKMGEKLVEEHGKAEEAVAGMQQLQTARSLLNSGMVTGSGAEFLTSAGNFLSSRLGFKEFQDPVANTQAYAASMGRQVGQIIKLFGSGTGLSDADREYAEKIAAGKITMNEAALRKLLDINERVYIARVKKYNEKAQEVMDRPEAKQLPYSLIVDFREPPMPGAIWNEGKQGWFVKRGGQYFRVVEKK